MKLYFLLPGKDHANGLLFLCNDSDYVKMGDYIYPGGVADIYLVKTTNKRETQEVLLLCYMNYNVFFMN
jgi:hypothetical protein